MGYFYKELSIKKISCSNKLQFENAILKMKYFKLPILLLICVAQFSCNYDKYSNRIKSNKGTYWDVVKINQHSFAESKEAWYFGVDGTLKKYTCKKNEKGIVERLLIAADEKWELNSDTLAISNKRNFIFHSSGKKNLLIPLNGTHDTIELRESEIQ